MNCTAMRIWKSAWAESPRDASWVKRWKNFPNATAKEDHSVHPDFEVKGLNSFISFIRDRVSHNNLSFYLFAKIARPTCLAHILSPIGGEFRNGGSLIARHALRF